MLKCPKCGATLPAGIEVCQFCGADLSAVPRPPGSPRPAAQSFGPPKWVPFVYNLIALYWVVDGGFDLVSGLSAKEPSTISAVFGGFWMMIGVGLLLRVEFVRGIVNILSFLKIGFGLLAIVGGLVGSATFGTLALIIVLFGVIDVVTGGLMVYLIGETD